MPLTLKRHTNLNIPSLFTCVDDLFLVLKVSVCDDVRRTINACLLLKTTLFNNITHPFFMRSFYTLTTTTYYLKLKKEVWDKQNIAYESVEHKNQNIHKI